MLQRIKLNQIFLVVYLIVLSILLKKILFAPLILTGILIILDSYINPDLKNLLYLIAAITPFLPLLFIFLFYLPFAVYGRIFEDSHFVKKYIFGYSLSFFSAAFVYIISILTNITIDWKFLIFAYYFPVLVMLFRIFRKRNGFKTLLSIYKIESKELTVLIISFLFLFYVAGQIINDHNLYMSNGTYVYTKFFSVVEGLKKFNEVPQYDEKIGEGEQLFLTDTPTFFTNLAFISTILNWIHPVLFYNSITAFVIWLSIIGAWLLVYELLDSKKDDYFIYIIAVVGALSIVLSFTYLQLFESFKQAFSFPYEFLGLAIIFSGSKRPVHLLAIAALFMASFLTHPTKAVGAILIAAFSFLLMILAGNPKGQIFGAVSYARKNKIKIFLVLIIFLLIPVFYLYPGYYYRNYARSGHFPSFSEIHPIEYAKAFFYDKNTNPLSFKYPDLRRIDEKKYGFFFTFLGLVSLLWVLFQFKSAHFKKTALFSMAFMLHFAVSSIIANMPPFAQGEYNYRTAIPFLLVVLIACIAVSIYNLNKKIMKIFLLLIFFGAFLHASYSVKQNLANIHSEEIIAGQTFSNEINLVNRLPIDGRIITFGMYSNAVDTAMSALTGHYFSRYGYLQWDFEDNIYDKLTSMNSFGIPELIQPLSSNELSNYLRLAGYKYAFLNICHPTGALVLEKLYPNNSYPLYQSPTNKCFVFLEINNSNYAEKIDVVMHVNESEYKNANGYWYITFNRNKKIHNFNLEPYLNYVADNPKKPVALSFNRINPYQVEIFGDFKKNGWVVFKEEYFPRWKAYMDGKEIPLIVTNNRMMLMKTEEGNKIKLIYSMPYIEKIAVFLSLPALIALVLVFAIAV